MSTHSIAEHISAVVPGHLGQSVQLLQFGQTVIQAGLINELANFLFIPGQDNCSGAVARIRDRS
jgi:hypothetical protein